MSARPDHPASPPGASRGIGAPTEFVAGLFFAAQAALGLWLLHELRLGTAMRMGPGFLPTTVCYGLLVLGLIMVGRSFFTVGAPLDRWYPRPLAFVLGSLIVFALTIEPLGLFATILLVVAVAAFATPESRWREAIVTALALAGFSVLVFVWLLGLPIASWPQVF